MAGTPKQIRLNVWVYPNFPDRLRALQAKLSGETGKVKSQREVLEMAVKMLEDAK